jgi:hypothetical protein
VSGSCSLKDYNYATSLSLSFKKLLAHITVQKAVVGRIAENCEFNIRGVQL